MGILIRLFVFHLRLVYFFLKLLPTNNKKIVLMSRQYSYTSIDYQMIENDIADRYPNFKVVVLARTLEKKLSSVIPYYFHLYRQMYHLATSASCVIDTYIIPVSVLNHKNNLLIVQLCHGVGTFKKFGYQALDRESGRNEQVSRLMRMHENYDYLISTSEESSKHYSEAFNVSTDTMLNFGPPKIDYILRVKEKRNEVLSKYPGLADKPVILYVSTFRTYKNDYLEKLTQHLPLDDFNVIIHLHPVIYTLHPEYDELLDQVEGLYRCKDILTVDLLSVADYVISDYSSFIFESALLGTPTYLYHHDYNTYTDKNGLNVDLRKELAGAVFDDANSLFTAIKTDEYNYAVLEAFKNKHIENTQGNSTTQLVDLLIDHAEEVSAQTL
ncbi:MAG: CDP-glycerol glycerophosphotransferase family protein [Coriobacteriia bacterium]|nr:CDP-glycerol glycerophosphotransferase family protein [Coriobacteriia bacterium]